MRLAVRALGPRRRQRDKIGSDPLVFNGWAQQIDKYWFMDSFNGGVK